MQEGIESKILAAREKKRTQRKLGAKRAEFALLTIVSTCRRCRCRCEACSFRPADRLKGAFVRILNLSLLRLRARRLHRLFLKVKFNRVILRNAMLVRLYYVRLYAVGLQKPK